MTAGAVPGPRWPFVANLLALPAAWLIHGRRVSLDDEQLDKLSFLAQIAIAPPEHDAIREQLTSIIAMVDAITAADTRGVAPLAHPLDATLQLRADVVTERDDRELLQRNAPLAQDGFYLVPRVVD